MFNRLYDNLPEYYHSMYLDGYTPEQIRLALHKTMTRQMDENNSINEIKVTSEV